ncbi:MAG TPA: hypothetical protein VNK04_05760 [Gemmataceae bacterium]|nr:hypothetical protein [Gemmataceae bacterium]
MATCFTGEEWPTAPGLRWRRELTAHGQVWRAEQTYDRAGRIVHQSRSDGVLGPFYEITTDLSYDAAG